MADLMGQSIYRGTTPELTIKMNTELDLGQAIQMWATIRSHTGTITKNITDITVDTASKKIIVPLTQMDTLSLNGDKAEVQIRILMANGKSYASEIATVNIKRILKDGVIKDGEG